MNGAEAQTIPFLLGSHEQAFTLRKQLEDVFGSLALARDVVTACLELGHADAGDFSGEIAHVLRRCAADRLSCQMCALTAVIERLGGKTTLSEAKDIPV